MSIYQNGKIYCITSPNHEKCYIGCTVKTLNKRMTKHKADYVQFQKNKGAYTSSFDIIAAGDAIISLIENFPCDTKKELEDEETRMINQFNNTINIDKKQGIISTDAKDYRKQYVEKNKNIIVERNRIYYTDNRDILLEKRKIYVEKNRDVVLEKKRDYHFQHRDTEIERSREFYYNNRDKILTKNGEQITCSICGKTVTFGHISRHQKSKYCQSYRQQPCIIPKIKLTLKHPSTI